MNDKENEFIGAELVGVSVVDEALNKSKVPDVYDGNCMFVDIETNLGVLQFTAYNCHNGYYGHDARVVCEQLNYNTYL